MLSLIFGRAGSGKTQQIEMLIKQRAQAGKHSVLIVAEQFTSTTELSSLKKFGDSLCHHITVADFGRIARMVFEHYGGASPLVGDAYRVALCRRAILSLKGQLTYYTSDSHSIGFYSLCADIIKELKMCCTPQQLIDLAKSEKLRDIALIYSAYNSLLSGRKEPQDLLLSAAHKIVRHPDFLKDTAFFIDGFDGFTYPEYEIIGSLLAIDRRVTVGLCAPSTQSCDDFFDTVRLTASRLKRLATKQGAPIASPDIVLYENYRNDGGLELLNMMLSGEEVELPPQIDDITLTPYPNRAEEAFAVAAAIHAEVMAGRAYKDIAIVMRNTDDYYSELMRSLELFSIPVYLDLEGELKFCAPAGVVSALLSLKGQLNSDDILSLIATGLCGLEQDELASLQDWVLRFNPTAADWRGGVTIPQEDELAGRSWCAGEPVRKKLMGFLAPLYSSDKPLAVIIYDVICNLKVSDNIQGDEQLRRYNLIIDILDQLYSLDPDGTLKPEELQHLYNILLQNTKLHSLPRVIDCVTVYQPDRIVGDEIKSLYIMGVNSEVFPAEVGASGLLDHSDRELLAQQELLLPGLFINRVMLEDLYLYRAVTTPSENLHISYITENGAKLSTALLPISGIAKPHLPGRFEQLATADAAAVVLSKQMFSDHSDIEMIKDALRLNGDARLISAMSDAANPPCFNLQDEQLTAQLIKNLSLSAGRVSSYRRCAFSFFMQHILKVEPIRRLELSADIAGTLIHYIMERLMGEHTELTTLSDEKLFTLCRQYTSECVDKLFGDRVSVSQQFLIERLERSAAQLLLFLRQEQGDSAFRPQRLEQDLSHSITTPDGLKLTLRGKVDRIDSCTIDGERYIRVVDYKTGNKTFSLKDVQTGIDIQLFLYLFYAAEKGEIPSGTFYLHNRPRQEDGGIKYRYDGAALKEDKLLKAICLQHTSLKTKPDGSLANGQENRLFDMQKADRIKRHIDELLFEIATDMSRGEFDARPVEMANGPCDYCGYRIICRKSDSDGRECRLESVSKPFEE